MLLCISSPPQIWPPHVFPNKSQQNCLLVVSVKWISVNIDMLAIYYISQIHCSHWYCILIHYSLMTVISAECCCGWTKTKTKVQNLGTGQPPSDVSVDAHHVECVDNFTYLGSVQSSDNYSGVWSAPCSRTRPLPPRPCYRMLANSRLRSA